MIGFATMLGAWALSTIVYTIAVLFVGRAKGSRNSGFGEAFRGIFILLAIPGFLSALIVGWPAISLLAGIVPNWLLPLAAGALFAFAMLVLSALMLPAGWRGAAHALTGFGAVLGLVWGGLDLLGPVAA